MKTCSTCRAVYHDENLNFCLKDGTTLFEGKAAKQFGAYKSSFIPWTLRFLQATAILSFVISVGSCTACVALGEREYGQEEEYAPGKMGARSYSKHPEQDRTFAIISITSGVAFIATGFGSFLFIEMVGGSRSLAGFRARRRKP